MHYLLLPKMTRDQMKVVGERLALAGCSVELSDSLLAKCDLGTVHVEPSGFCRSTTDVADLVFPAIPDIIASEKERTSLGELKSKYLVMSKSGKKTKIRIYTRAECWLSWDFLRASNSCGLAPDEHAVASFLLAHSKGATMMVTDFPEEGCAVKLLGGRRYFNSKISSPRAAETLRVAGAKSSENSYLRRDGMLEFAEFERPSSEDWLRLFNGLGEWCYFAPE